MEDEKSAPTSSAHFSPIEWAKKKQLESPDNDTFGQVKGSTNWYINKPSSSSSSSSNIGFDRNQSWNNNVYNYYGQQQEQSQSSFQQQQQRNYLTQYEKVRLLERLTSKFLPRHVTIPTLDLSPMVPTSSSQGPVLQTGLEKRYAYNQSGYANPITTMVSGWRAPLIPIHEDQTLMDTYLTVAPTTTTNRSTNKSSDDGKMATCRNDATNQLMEIVSNRVIPVMMSPKKGLQTMYIGSIRLELTWIDDVTLTMSEASSQMLYQFLRERMIHAREQSTTVWRYVFNLRLTISDPDQGYNICVVIDAAKEQITFYDPIGASHVKEFLRDTIQPTLIKNLTDLLKKPSPLLIDGKINFNGLLLQFSKDYCFSMTPLIFVLECFLGDSNRVTHCFNFALEKSKAYERYFIENIQKLNSQLNNQLRELSSCGTSSGDGHAGVLSCDISGVNAIVAQIFKLVGVNSALIF